MPPKAKPRSSATADDRVVITDIPAGDAGDVGAYVLVAHMDKAGNVLNNFDVVEMPEGAFDSDTELLNDPKATTALAGATYGDALRWIASRVDKDTKGMATQAAPATVTPIKRKATPTPRKAPVKKAPAAKKAPTATKVGGTKKRIATKKAPARSGRPSRRPTKAS
jgi:hypothetical protein